MSEPASTQDDGSSFTERRTVARQRALVGAVIVLDNKMSTFECVVRNRSDEGFLLRLPDTIGVPDAFDLLVGIDEHRFRCEVRWRNATDLGVQTVPDTRGKASTATPQDPPEKAALRDMADRLAARFPHLAKKS